MKIYVFHYHFLPGGVTDVVIASVQSWLLFSRETESVTLVSGRPDNLDSVEKKILGQLPPSMKSRFKTRVFPSIDYFENTDGNTDSHELSKELISLFGGQDSVWWIHNYHLGKNPRFTGALLETASRSPQKMIFHIHDFPECTRFDLLKRLIASIEGDLYSFSPTVRYAVINSRDYKNLIDAGLPREKIFLLENPLQISDKTRTPASGTAEELTSVFSERFPRWKKNEGYMLYPVRAIRRKNIAEAAFLALLADRNIIISLPGISSTEKKYSDRCKKIFTDGLVPGMFAIGMELEKTSVTFDDMVSSASLIISSSVQEGFGYLYLNSLNWGKPLIARDLDILDSFKPAFDGYNALFYNSLSIPVKLLPIGKLQSLYREKTETLISVLSSSTTERLKEDFNHISEEEAIDFSYLSLSMQIDLIKAAAENDSILEECRNLNKSLVKTVKKYFSINCIQPKDILEKNWSKKNYCSISDVILKDFNLDISPAEQNKDIKPIYETLLEKFATPPYLRLIYDE